MGYHKTEITKGVLGTTSKIAEELDELKDAEQQGIKILMLCELADLVGAVDWYLRKQFPSLSIKDLQEMATATEAAFKDGER